MLVLEVPWSVGNPLPWCLHLLSLWTRGQLSVWNKLTRIYELQALSLRLWTDYLHVILKIMCKTTFLYYYLNSLDYFLSNFRKEHKFKYKWNKNWHKLNNVTFKEWLTSFTFKDILWYIQLTCCIYTLHKIKKTAVGVSMCTIFSQTLTHYTDSILKVPITLPWSQTPSSEQPSSCLSRL